MFGLEEKKKLNDGWQQQCFEVPFSLTSLCCSIIKKQKEKDFNWINTHSMGHLLCLLFQHLGIAGKLSFIVAAEGFQGSKERREEGLSYHSSGGGAQAHLWPTHEELPQFLAGSRETLPSLVHHVWLWLFHIVRMWLWKLQARLKSWWCARDKIQEKSLQKPFPDACFDISSLPILTHIS